jgi:hypothetical protein
MGNYKTNNPTFSSPAEDLFISIFSDVFGPENRKVIGHIAVNSDSENGREDTEEFIVHMGKEEEIYEKYKNAVSAILNNC